MHFNNPSRIKVFFKDANKKHVLKICQEVLVLWVTKREVPLYYFKHLYKKNIKNYRDYLGPKQVAAITRSKQLHQREYTSILNNKLNFALYCERYNIPTPALLGHNFKSSFFRKNEVYQITTQEELIRYFKKFFDANTVQALFFRPLAQYGGSGCFKIDRINYAERLKKEYHTFLQGDYTHTAVIEQHSEINRMYDKSINTLRILTHFDRGAGAVIAALFRVGTGGSVVDNGSSGGLSIGINQDSGTLKGKSHLDMKFGGGELEKHPDSGVQFEGFNMPFFKEACELCLKAAQKIPNGFVGWDIAITPKGPVVIEGNENPNIFVSDVLYGGLLKNPYMRNLINCI